MQGLQGSVVHDSSRNVSKVLIAITPQSVYPGWFRRTSFLCHLSLKPPFSDDNHVIEFLPCLHSVSISRPGKNQRAVGHMSCLKTIRMRRK